MLRGKWTRAAPWLLPWLGLAVRLVLAGVWLVAGLIKLPHPESSVTAVRAYQLLSADMATFVGRLLPVVEVLLGAILLLGLLTRVGGVLSALLQVAFIVGIASVWARGISIDCGCFGGGGADPDAISAYPWEVARDVGLLLLAGYLVVRPRTALALDTWLFPAHKPAEEAEVEEKVTEDVQGQP
jgi:uncharacterized membrane protein YphA (DoxX/SURF4 family)